MPTATVPVKSSWSSKINWTQAVAAIVTFATALIAAANLPAAQATELTAAVAGIGQLATIVLRTFFTTAVTTASVGSQ